MTNSYSFPTDPEPIGHDSTGAPIYEWADPAAECHTCDHSPTGLCPDCCWACTGSWCPEHLEGEPTQGSAP